MISSPVVGEHIYHLHACTTGPMESFFDAAITQLIL